VAARVVHGRPIHQGTRRHEPESSFHSWQAICKFMFC